MHPECMLCHQLLLEFQGLLAAHCGHIFHAECLLPWFQRCTMCPHCQQQCQANRLIPIHFWSAQVPPEGALDLRQKVLELKMAVSARDMAIKNLQEQSKDREVLKSTLEEVTASRDALSRELKSTRHAQNQLKDRLRAVQNEEEMRRRHADLRYRLVKQQLRLLQRKLKPAPQNDAFTQTGDTPTTDQKSGSKLQRTPLAGIENVVPPSLLRVPKKRSGLSSDANRRRRREVTDPLTEACQILSRTVPTDEPTERIVEPTSADDRNSKGEEELVKVVANSEGRKRRVMENGGKRLESKGGGGKAQRKIEDFFSKRK